MHTEIGYCLVLTPFSDYALRVSYCRMEQRLTIESVFIILVIIRASFSLDEKLLLHARDWMEIFTSFGHFIEKNALTSKPKATATIWKLGLHGST